MASTTLSLLFIYLLKRAWKNGKVKRNIFWKSSSNFIFGQDNCRKSDFARLNSSKAVLLEISYEWRYLITFLRDISAVVITQFQGQTQEPCHI